MIKEHLVSASVTNGTECICNPEVLLGTNRDEGLFGEVHQRSAQLEVLREVVLPVHTYHRLALHTVLGI